MSVNDIAISLNIFFAADQPKTWAGLQHRAPPTILLGHCSAIGSQAAAAASLEFYLQIDFSLKWWGVKVFLQNFLLHRLAD
jgi:hypothetical protein